MDESTKIAVNMDIGHIEELYGHEGLILAMDILKEKLKDYREKD